MPDPIWPGKVLYRQSALARARRFQIETTIVATDDGRKRVFKRALHTEGVAHLRRMAANHQIMRDMQGPVSSCACEMRDTLLEMPYIEGQSLHQQLLRAIAADDRAGIESLLARYRGLVTGFDRYAAELIAPDGAATLFVDDIPREDALVLSGNIDQGFDHWIARDERMVLIDYEWLLGVPLPLNYVLYRAAQLFFQDVPPPLSPRFRLRDMCELMSISPRQRQVYDRLEAHFQRFVRFEAG